MTKVDWVPASTPPKKADWYLVTIYDWVGVAEWVVRDEKDEYSSSWHKENGSIIDDGRIKAWAPLPEPYRGNHG